MSKNNKSETLPSHKKQTLITDMGKRKVNKKIKNKNKIRNRK